MRSLWLVSSGSRKILSCERGACFVNFWRQHSALCLPCLPVRAPLLSAAPHQATSTTRRRCQRLASGVQTKKTCCMLGQCCW